MKALKTIGIAAIALSACTSRHGSEQEAIKTAQQYNWKGVEVVGIKDEAANCTIRPYTFSEPIVGTRYNIRGFSNPQNEHPTSSPWLGHMTYNNGVICCNEGKGCAEDTHYRQIVDRSNVRVLR